MEKVKKNTKLKMPIPENSEKKLLKLFKDYKVENDILDYNALWDTKLNEFENLRIMEEKIRTLANSKNTEETIVTDFKKRKKGIKTERELKAYEELEQLKKLEENMKTQFENSAKEIKETSSKIIDEIYYIPKEYIKSLIKGNINSLIFLGKQGCSKSFTTLSVLNKLNANYSYHSGFSSPLSLYKYLYENRDSKIIVIDDVYGLINNSQAVSIILNALYSATKKRIITWDTTSKLLKNVPTEFIFNSKIILITNELPKHINADLVLSRCLSYRIELSYNELLLVMYEIAKQKHEKLTKEERFMIVDYIKNQTDETTINFDLRLQQKIEKLYLYDKQNWQKLSEPLLKCKNENFLLVKKLLQECSTIKEAENKFVKESGMCRKSFYNFKNKLSINKFKIERIKNVRG